MRILSVFAGLRGGQLLQPLQFALHGRHAVFLFKGLDLFS